MESPKIIAIDHNKLTLLAWKEQCQYKEHFDISLLIDRIYVNEIKYGRLLLH